MKNFARYQIKSISFVFFLDEKFSFEIFFYSKDMASRPSRKTITIPIDDDQTDKERDVVISRSSSQIEVKKRSRSMVHWMSKPWNKNRERYDSNKTTTLSNASPTTPVELKSPKKIILDTDKKAERSPSVFQYVFFS